jgi:uncharacterized repeat protein (TIGR03847 family)
MPGLRYLFDSPDRFIVGTIGAAGEREFYFQIRQGDRLISMATEKSQAAALAERISTIIKEIKKSAPLAAVVNSTRDEAPLELPLDNEFTVGAIGIAFDAAALEIEISFSSDQQPINDGDESDNSVENSIVQVTLDLSQSLSFVIRTQALVAAGRPLCPFCTQAIDPRGHLCPRANGYRR